MNPAASPVDRRDYSASHAEKAAAGIARPVSGNAGGRHHNSGLDRGGFPGGNIAGRQFCPAPDLNKMSAVARVYNILLPQIMAHEAIARRMTFFGRMKRRRECIRQRVSNAMTPD